MRRKRYLQQYHGGIYTGLLLSGKHNAYLEEIDHASEDKFLQPVNQMAASEGVTEQFKAQNQILWVQRMNSVRIRATEIANHELIYETTSIWRRGYSRRFLYNALLASLALRLYNGLMGTDYSNTLLRFYNTMITRFTIHDYSGLGQRGLYNDLLCRR
jgi:hypothetical protein